MNTKFDVGQRVTYPVVYTADGNITGIAVSKAGVTRYAIGPKWYAEDDLKLTAEDKPDMGNPITEPATENKPEPVKLYCVKDFNGWLTKGKVYDFSGGVNYDHDDCTNHYGNYDIWKRSNPSFAACLVPLVHRPAKVGEWVYIVDADPAFCDWYNGNYKNGDVLKITSLPPVGKRGQGVMSGKNYLMHTEYLVLDGYHGDSE